MAGAGDVIRASDPVREVGNDVQTSNGGGVTAETESIWATGALLNGAVYEIHLHIKVASTVAGDDATVRIREDSVSGTLLQEVRDDVLSTAFPRPFDLRARYTASATGSKQFVGTIARSAGTGNVSRSASSTSPSIMTVTRVL